MYLIAGLGNPGTKYEMTRHNIGFHTIDYIADELGVKVKKLKYKGLYGECEIGGEKVLLLKPQTFMNLSGESIVEFVKFFKIPVENVIIISDDISLDTGRIRVRPKGSAGGHNGLKNIIAHLGTDKFPRIKLGAGQKPGEYPMVDWVLGRIPKTEEAYFQRVLEYIPAALEKMVNGDIDSAMCDFNGVNTR